MATKVHHLKFRIEAETSELKKVKNELTSLEQSIINTNDRIRQIGAAKKAGAKGFINADIVSSKELHDELKKLQEDYRRIANERANATPSKRVGLTQKLSGVRAEIEKAYNKELTMQQNLLDQLALKEKKATQATRERRASVDNLTTSLNKQNSTYRTQKRLVLDSLAQQKKLAQKQRADVKFSLAQQKRQEMATRSSISFMGKLKDKITGVSEAQRRATGATKTYTKAIDNQSTSLVRHIRQLESYAVVFFAIKAAYKSTLGAGLEFAKTIENSEIKIQTILASSSHLSKVDSAGLSKAEQQLKIWNIAAEDSKDIIKKLKVLNLETPHTFAETTKIFGALLPQARAAKATTEEVLQLTKLVSIAASGGNVTMREMMTSIDNLVSGEAKTGEMVNFLKTIGIEMGELKHMKGHEAIEFLIKELSKLEPAGKILKSSWDGMVSQMKTSWETLWGAVAHATFWDDAKNSMADITTYLKENNDSIVSGIEIAYNSIKPIVSETLQTIQDIGSATLETSLKIADALHPAIAIAIEDAKQARDVFIEYADIAIAKLEQLTGISLTSKDDSEALKTANEEVQYSYEGILDSEGRVVVTRTEMANANNDIATSHNNITDAIREHKDGIAKLILAYGAFKVGGWIARGLIRTAELTGIISEETAKVGKKWVREKRFIKTAIDGIKWIVKQLIDKIRRIPRVTARISPSFERASSSSVNSVNRISQSLNSLRRGIRGVISALSNMASTARSAANAAKAAVNEAKANLSDAKSMAEKAMNLAKLAKNVGKGIFASTDMGDGAIPNFKSKAEADQWAKSLKSGEESAKAIESTFKTMKLPDIRKTGEATASNFTEAVKELNFSLDSTTKVTSNMWNLLQSQSEKAKDWVSFGEGEAVKPLKKKIELIANEPKIEPEKPKKGKKGKTPAQKAHEKLIKDQADLDDRFNKATKDKYDYQAYLAKKQYDEDIKNGLDKFKADAVYQNKLANIEGKRYSDAKKIEDRKQKEQARLAKKAERERKKAEREAKRKAKAEEARQKKEQQNLAKHYDKIGQSDKANAIREGMETNERTKNGATEEQLRAERIHKEDQDRYLQRQKWFDMIGEIGKAVKNENMMAVGTLSSNIGKFFNTSDSPLKAMQNMDFGMMGSAIDMLTNSQTKSAEFSQYGGALGSIAGTIFGNPAVGQAIGSGIGAVVGGLFGSTKDKGFRIGEGGIDDISKWKQKKSWISKKNKYSDLNSWETQGIRDAYDAYSQILDDFNIKGEMFIHEGNYKNLGSAFIENFYSVLEKDFKNPSVDIGSSVSSIAGGLKDYIANVNNFIVNPDEVANSLQSWKDYAKSIDKDVSEIFLNALNKFSQFKTSFKDWSIGFNKDDNLEQLKFREDIAKRNLDKIKKDIGEVESVNVYNFLDKMKIATKSLDKQDIEKWTQLGEALKASAIAKKRLDDKIIKDRKDKLKEEITLWQKEAKEKAIHLKEIEKNNDKLAKAYENRKKSAIQTLLGANSYMNTPQKMEYSKNLYEDAYQSGNKDDALNYGKQYLDFLSQYSRNDFEIQQAQTQYANRFGAETQTQQVEDKKQTEEIKNLKVELSELKATIKDQTDFFEGLIANDGSSLRVSDDSAKYAS